MQKKISIIIPVYKVEDYIHQCIQSIIQQDVEHSAVECILINDCTPDRSMKVLEDTLAAYDGGMDFRILNHQENQGSSVCRNDGIKEATGEYILFVDSDDYLLKGCLSELLSAAQRHPEADLLIGNIYDEYLQCNTYPLKHEQVLTNPNQLYMGTFKHYTVWNMLIRRSMLLESQVCFLKGIYMQDALFNYLLFPFVRQAVVIPTPTYFYRKNMGGVTLDAKWKKATKTMLDYQTILRLFSTNLKGNTYVGKSLFAYEIASRGLDFFYHNQTHIDHAQTAEGDLLRIIKNLLVQHIANGRLFLFLLFLLLLPPFSRLMRIRLYRRYFNHITALFGSPALFFDCMHRHPAPCPVGQL